MDPQHLKVLMNTVVVRPPKQGLATFGTTVVTYNLVTAPLYRSLDVPGGKDEAVIRRGTVKAEPPKIVTPDFLMRSEGFGAEAREFLRELARRGQGDDPGMLYTYSNEPGGMEIVSNRPEDVAERISERIERESKPLEAVILGVDELWDVSLMKFIFDLTHQSAPDNAADFRRSGRMAMANGVPQDALLRIEEMFAELSKGNLDPAILHRELEAWNIFDQYEDRFFNALRGRSARGR